MEYFYAPVGIKDVGTQYLTFSEDTTEMDWAKVFDIVMVPL
jgi:hypothetical protein